MVAEGVHRRDRQGVDRFGPDQLIDVENVGVSRVLGPGRRPEGPLHARPADRKRCEGLPAEDLLEAAIGELGIGDRRLATEGKRVLGADRLQLLVDLGVHPADEERSHRRHPGRFGAGLEPAEIGMRHSLVVREREHQGRVDVDALADQTLDSRDPLGRRRHLDHQVRTIDRPPQASRLHHGSLGVPGEVGRDLETHVPVATRVRLPHGS